MINNIRYNHCHDADFIIERPHGSDDNLLLLIQTEVIIIIEKAVRFIHCENKNNT